jgi:hypothetical protein
MDEKVQAALDEVVITLEFALKDVNVLLNALNAPFATPAMIAAAFIQGIQQQAGPQVDKARTAIEAALGDKKDEPQAAS